MQSKNISLNDELVHLRALNNETKSLQLDLETLNEEVEITISYEEVEEDGFGGFSVMSDGTIKTVTTFKTAFDYIKDELLLDPYEFEINRKLAKIYLELNRQATEGLEQRGKILESGFKSLLMRFLACSLIDFSSQRSEYGGSSKKIHLTDFGKKVMAIY